MLEGPPVPSAQGRTLPGEVIGLHSSPMARMPRPRSIAMNPKMNKATEIMYAGRQKRDSGEIRSPANMSHKRLFVAEFMPTPPAANIRWPPIVFPSARPESPSFGGVGRRSRGGRLPSCVGEERDGDTSLRRPAPRSRRQEGARPPPDPKG